MKRMKNINPNQHRSIDGILLTICCVTSYFFLCNTETNKNERRL